TNLLQKSLQRSAITTQVIPPGRVPREAAKLTLLGALKEDAHRLSAIEADSTIKADPRPAAALRRLHPRSGSYASRASSRAWRRSRRFPQPSSDRASR